MHYYQFNIADYRKRTAPLTPVQHHIYRWLIDEYHLNEQPFNNDMPELLWSMSLSDEYREDLELILRKFFKPACDDDYKPVDITHHPEMADVPDSEFAQYWIHETIEENINEYKELKDKKSKAGKASAEARKNKFNSSSTPVELCSDSVEQTNNHKPITNNHKPSNRGKKFTPPALDEVSGYFLERGMALGFTQEAEKFIDFYESKGWMVGKNKMKDWKAAVRNWERRDNDKQNNGSTDTRSRAKKVSDELDNIAKEAIERGEGF